MSNKNSQRLFIALPLDSQFRKPLNRIRKKISNFPHIKLVPKSNLHLTLVFLGSINSEEIPNIEKTIEKIISNYPGFEIKASRIAAFRDMIWIEFEENEELLKLQETLRKSLCKYKLEKKEFKPHITLARFPKNISDFADRNLDLLLGSQSLNLYSSKLTPEGAEHEIIAQFNFLSKDSQI